MDTERWEQRNRARMERHRLRMERRQARWAQWGTSCSGRNPATGMILGLAIIAVGVLFLLQNLGYVYFDNIGQFWPVILIAVGISKLANTHRASSVTGGLILTGLGTIFLLRNLDFIRGDIWRYIWPGVLIAVGLSILVKHLEGRDHSDGRDYGDGGGAEPNRGIPPSGPGAPPNAGFRSSAFASSAFASSGFTGTSSHANSLHIENVFSGTRQKIDSQDFEGGKIAVVFGGAEIDLRSAATKREEISIKAEAVFGGIELWVPAHWQTIVRGTGVFGSFEDKTWPAAPGTQSKAPRLIVTGGAVFGSVIVKN